MRSKVLAIATIALGLSLNAAAQEKELSLGVRAGGGVSYSNVEETSGTEVKSVLVGNLGAVAVYRPNTGYLSYVGALSYCGQGYRVETADVSFLGNTIPGVKSSTRWHNIALDLGARFNFLKKAQTPYAGLGIRAGYRAGVTVNTDDADADYDKDAAKGTYEGTNKLLFNGVVNVGYQANRVFAELEFAPGFSGIQKDLPDGADATRLTTFGVNVGFLF